MQEDAPQHYQQLKTTIDSRTPCDVNPYSKNVCLGGTCKIRFIKYLGYAGPYNPFAQFAHASSNNRFVAPLRIDNNNNNSPRPTARRATRNVRNSFRRTLEEEPLSIEIEFD